MTRWKRAEWRKICIRYNTIEQRYGKGNFDDAGDDIVAELRSLFEYSEQYCYRFNEDCSHSNPWFHALIFEIEGVTDTHFEQLLQRIIALGLEDASIYV